MSSRPPLNRPIVWLLAAVLSATTAAFARAQDLTFPDTRWEALPRTVRSMRVSPTGRMWFDRWTTVGKYLVGEDLKRHLEAEYAKATPFIKDARFALLDDQGTAWFYPVGGTQLLGYDGKQWIEQQVEKGDFFIGHCPSRGQLSDNEANHAAGGVAWFLSKQGIHRYDGRSWSFQELGPTRNGAFQRPLLSVCPNGKFAVAHKVGDDRFWICREGEWSDVASPLDAQEELWQLILTDSGRCWFLSRSGVFGSITLIEDAGEAPAAFERWVSELASEKFDQREAAAKKLLQLGSAAAPRLEAALRKAQDAEVRRRLQEILRAVTKKPSKGPTPVARHVVQDVIGVYQDSRGRMFTAARSVEAPDGSTGPGLVIVEADGRDRVVRADSFLEGWQPRIYKQSVPLLTPAGDKIWVPQINGDRGAYCLDLTRGTIVDVMPNPKFAYLYGIDSDERVFVGDSDVSARMVYSPRSPDPRIPLTVEKLRWNVDFMWVAADGAVWIHSDDLAVRRFDGREWREMGRFPTREVPFASESDLVVIGLDEGVTLFQGTQALGRAADVKSLIEKHRERIAAGFRDVRSPPDLSHYSLTISADRDKNIWLRERARLHVLHENEWTALEGPLKEADSPYGVCVYLAQVGDGLRQYTTDCGTGRTGRSFFVSWQEGKPVLEKAPHSHSDTPAAGTRDLSGALWVSGYIPSSAGNGTGIVGQFTSRIERVDAVRELKNSGQPLLVDRSGTVWLHHIRNETGRICNLWRDGKVTAQLEIPYTDKVLMGFSDAVDSVYLRTSFGLQHVRRTSSQPGGYQLRRPYSLPGVNGEYLQCAYSSLGYFVVRSYGNGGNALYLVKLPTRE